MVALAAADTTVAAAAEHPGVINLQALTSYGSPLPSLCRYVSRAVRIERRRLTSKVYAPSFLRFRHHRRPRRRRRRRRPHHLRHTRHIVYHWARHR